MPMPQMTPPATMAVESRVPPTDSAGQDPGAGGEAVGREAGKSHGGERKNVGEGGERGGADHGAGVVALRVLHFARDGGGVVPAHVVPERDEDGSGESGAGVGPGGRAAPVHGGMLGEAVPEAEEDEGGEGGEE